MATFKEVFYFSSNGSTGGAWTETWYSSGPDLASVASYSANFIASRMALAHPLTTLRKIRVSQVGSPRITTVVNINAPGTYTAEGPAPASEAAVCTVSSNIKPATRRWWIRGQDDSCCTRNAITGNDVFSPAFTKSVAAWLDRLKLNSYVVLPIEKPGTPGFEYHDIVNADGATTVGKTVLTLKTPIIVNPGDTVLISQVSKKDLPALQGSFQVLAVAGSTITVQYATPENRTIAVKVGRLRKRGFIEGAIIEPSISGLSFIGERKTKSPFSGSRGARSAKRGLRNSP